MKEEIKRICKLVADGKLSPADAADFIDAFYASDRAEATEEPTPSAEASTEPGATPPPPPPGAVKDPFKSLIDSIEKVTKEGLESVNWQEVSRQAREGAKRGIETLQKGFEDLSKGKVHLGWLTSQASKEVSLPLSIPVGKSLRIENPNGEIKVVGGFDIGTVTAQARFKGATVEEARQKAAEYTFIIEENDHSILIKQPTLSGLTVDLDVQYPGTGSIELRGENGDVQVMDTKGGCRATTRSGDISVRGLNGVIELNHASGDVSVEDVETPSLVIENQSGNITLKRVIGNVNARTASGDISLTACSGKVVSVESVSGDVNLDLTEPLTGTTNVRTMSGDAHVSMPDGADCHVSLSTLRGTVSSGIKLENEASTEQRITGILGAGSGSLDISAVTGDVSLVLRDSTQE